jgi:hypothetical protein
LTSPVSRLRASLRRELTLAVNGPNSPRTMVSKSIVWANGTVSIGEIESRHAGRIGPDDYAQLKDRLRTITSQEREE